MRAEPELIVEASAGALAQAAATRLIDTIVSAQSVRPLAYLAITAGSIIDDTFAVIRSAPGRDSVDWSRVSLWWGDERFVPADSPDRNDTGAFTALFDALPLEPANIHRMPASDGPYGDDVDASQKIGKRNARRERRIINHHLQNRAGELSGDDLAGAQRGN